MKQNRRNKEEMGYDARSHLWAMRQMPRRDRRIDTKAREMKKTLCARERVCTGPVSPVLCRNALLGL